MKRTLVTVSCQYGSDGHRIGERLAEVLELPFYDREYFSSRRQTEDVADEFGENRGEMGKRLYAFATGTDHELGICGSVALPEEDLNFLDLTDAVRLLAKEGGCVIMADGCEVAVGEFTHRIDVYVSGDKEDRVRRVASREGISMRAAKRRVKQMDKKSKSYCNFHAGARWGIPERYALCINSSLLGVDGSVATIRSAIDRKTKGT